MARCRVYDISGTWEFNCRKMKEKLFCKFENFFRQNSDRNIDFLRAVYNDSSRLQSSIERLMGESFLTSITDKRVLLKPNWVRHSVREDDDISLRTNDAFLLATLDVILRYCPKSVLVGDAPIQGCRWEEMIPQELNNSIQERALKNNIEITVRDFRRRVFDPHNNSLEIEKNPLSDYLIFDLGKESYLEPISENGGNFRVNDYDHRRLMMSHQKGIHKYCITKSLFDTDVVISMPKFKTHQKTGVTGALKNIVGLNGDKDFLPHHRVGGTGGTGDCYPGENPFRRLSELLIDHSNQKQGTLLYRPLRKFSSLFWMLSFPTKEQNRGAAWYGNDTAWRMVLDLNKIVSYGTSDGKISNQKQRTLYTLGDGIIGGQGNGPLFPEPHPMGIISFSNDSALHDLLMVELMKFDYNLLPLISEALKNIRLEECEITLNDKTVSISELKKNSIPTKAAPGWAVVLNRKS